MPASRLADYQAMWGRIILVHFCAWAAGDTYIARYAAFRA